MLLSEVFCSTSTAVLWFSCSNSLVIMSFMRYSFLCRICQLLLTNSLILEYQLRCILCVNSYPEVLNVSFNIDFLKVKFFSISSLLRYLSSLNDQFLNQSLFININCFLLYWLWPIYQPFGVRDRRLLLELINGQLLYI